ncbi:hypothetical protein BDR07DRAFT_1501032 [Suillus spraguei]|nr:hypothetical protein BDR07DRAFT_1501032 [Suillus spraguei]
MSTHSTQTIDASSPSLPSSLLLLPETRNWLAEIQAAYENIQHTYNNAIQVLRADSADPIHIAFHVDAISSNALPILEVLIPDNGIDSDLDTLESLPVKWLAEVATILGCVVSCLEHLVATVNENILFGPSRMSGFAAVALAAEQISGHYTMILTLLNLVQQLLHEVFVSVLTIPLDNQHLKQVKEEVLQAATFVYGEIWVEHQSWKYAQLGDRLEIG